MLNLIIFGPPGAGKGTQAERLKEKYNLMHLSTGEMLRSEMRAGTQLGAEARAYSDKGQLVPDEVVIGIIGSSLDQHKAAAGFIFDGFPRTIAQAKALDDLLEARKTKIAATLSLVVTDEELKNRLIMRGNVSGRADDQNEAIIENRIKEYNNKTAPLIDYYSKQNKLQSINGIGEIDVITHSLYDCIDKLSDPKH